MHAIPASPCLSWDGLPMHGQGPSRPLILVFHTHHRACPRREAYEGFFAYPPTRYIPRYNGVFPHEGLLNTR